VTLEPGALLLMSSDGLHGVVEESEMERILLGGRDGEALEASCRELIEAAKRAGGPDNITAVLVRRGA
jgi:protein phosphatase